MKQDFRRIWYTARAALFSTTIHGVLVAALVAGFLWPRSDTVLERGVVEPIQAEAISNQEIIEQVEAQKKRLSEKAKLAEDLEKLRKQQEEEQKRLETLEANRVKEQKQLEEEKRKREERERLEEEKRKREERERLEEEKRKREERERLEEEKRKREEQKRLEAERREQERVQREAENALQALFNEIATAVEEKWRVKKWQVTGKQGLKALIQIKVDRNGEVQVANVIESSGDRSFDESAQWAIERASPLPFPADPKYHEYISKFNFMFKQPDG